MIYIFFFDKIGLKTNIQKGLSAAKDAGDTLKPSRFKSILFLAKTINVENI